MDTATVRISQHDNEAIGLDSISRTSAGISRRNSTTDEPEPLGIPPVTTDSLIHPAEDYPEGGLRAWLVVFGSFCVVGAVFGFGSSSGILQTYWQQHQLKEYTTGNVGWILSVNSWFNLILGIQVGPLFDRYGARWLLLSGSLIYIISLLCMAQSTEYWQLMLSYGVLAGIGAALTVTTALSVISHYFLRNRARATGIVFAGSSIGGIFFPLFLKFAYAQFTWAWATRLVTLIITILLVIGNLTIKARFKNDHKVKSINVKLFKDSRFLWTTLAITGYEFVFFLVLGLLPTFALTQGFSSATSFNAIAALNAGSLLGRLCSGTFADRFGRFNISILTVIWSIIMVLGLWFPVGRQAALLYLFAPLFGFSSGSIISLAPVCLGQLTDVGNYGLYYGTSYAMVSFATLFCIPIGGDLLPALGARGFVGFVGGVLCLAFVAFSMARWACLEYTWKWRAKL